jgi:FkbM family methyltransferase
MTGWYHDPVLVASLPRRFRWYAAYCRAVARPGRIAGGSFLFRRLRDVARLLSWQRHATALVGPYALEVDLLDQRMLTALDELRHPDGLDDRLLDRALAPGALFVDVGANHGTWAVRAAHRVGPTGRVIAIEPNPVLARCVGVSLAMTGVPHAVHAVAVGAKAGEAPLHVPTDASGLASLVAGYAPGAVRDVTVPVAVLDDLLADVPAGTPCLLKLDIEGGELAALQGGRHVLRRLAPLIVWELNPRSAAAAGHGVAALFTAFAEAGYTRFAELDAWPATVRADAVDQAGQRNLLAVPGDA